MLGRAAPALHPSLFVHMRPPFPRSFSLLGPTKTTAFVASQSAWHSREEAVTGIGLRGWVRFFSDEAPAEDNKDEALAEDSKDEALAEDTKPPKKVGPLIYAVCKNCRRKGHMFWDCPEPVVCVACGDLGHRRSQCPNPDRKRPKAMKLAPKKCFRCLETGHVLKDCKALDKCHECGQEGHIRRDCPTIQLYEPPGICYNCGKEGHRQKACPIPRRNHRPRRDDGVPLPNMYFDTDPDAVVRPPSRSASRIWNPLSPPRPLRLGSQTQLTLSAVRQRLENLK